jgi:hypothetical protein
LWASIQVLTFIPEYFGDASAAFLPLYVAVALIILFAGRFGLERLINYLWPSASSSIIWNTTESFQTGTSAISVLIFGSVFTGSGLIHLRNDDAIFSEVSGDIDVSVSESDTSAKIVNWETLDAAA